MKMITRVNSDFKKSSLDVSQLYTISLCWAEDGFTKGYWWSYGTGLFWNHGTGLQSFSKSNKCSSSRSFGFNY